MRLRIISGKYGSRLIEAPAKASVHPMSDRMRTALFNKLGDIENKTFLDAFSGSGAVGIEAISRGAVSVMAIENDKQAYDTIKRNVGSLGITNHKVVRANVFGWVNKSDAKFDIIVADPPYDTVDPKKVVDKLKNHLNTSGTMILSHSGRAEPPNVDGVVVVGTRSYANGALTFYQSQ